MNSLVLSGSTEVALSSDAVKARDALLLESRTIAEVADDFALDTAVQTLRQLKDCADSTEKSRTEVKAPVLKLERLIESIAKQFVAPIEAERQRLNGLVRNYTVEQERIRQEAERKRQAELARIEREKREAEEKERRKQEEIRRAEEAARKAAAEAEASFDTDEISKAESEAKAAEERRQQAEREAQAERQRQEQLKAEKAKAQIQLPVAAKPQGLVVRDVWKFEVIDIRQVYGAAPHLCRVEASASAINEAIRNGLRDCPGLRIWSEKTTGVR